MYIIMQASFTPIATIEETHVLSALLQEREPCYAFPYSTFLDSADFTQINFTLWYSKLLILFKWWFFMFPIYQPTWEGIKVSIWQYFYYLDSYVGTATIWSLFSFAFSLPLINLNILLLFFKLNFNLCIWVFCQCASMCITYTSSAHKGQ